MGMFNLRLPATHTEGVCYNRGITLSNQLSAVSVQPGT